MTISIVGFLVALVVICLVFWAARAIMAAFKIEDPIATLVYVALVIVVIFWLLGMSGHGPAIRLT